MRIVRTIGEYLLFAIFILGIIFIYGGIRTFPPQWLFLFMGLALTIVPATLFIIYYRAFHSKLNDLESKNLADLKATGMKIPVDLTQCVIKSNNWVTEAPRYSHSDVVFLNEISGDGDKNVEKVSSSVSVIQYIHNLNGKRKVFKSSSINKDKTTLMLLLEIQKQTFIYVDRDNLKNYYFDLEFIKDDEDE